MREIPTTQLDSDLADGKYGDVIVFDPERGFWLRVLDGKGGVASMPELGMSLPQAYDAAWDLGHRPTYWATVDKPGIHPIPSSVLRIGSRRAAVVTQEGEKAVQSLVEALRGDAELGRLDRPDDPNSAWVMDFGPNGNGAVTVSWLYGIGYALFPNEGEAAWGEPPSEIMDDASICAEGVRSRLSDVRSVSGITSSR